ncbi:hypothetical protein DVH24_027916 [Malus domestica]|uniref:F-box associated beta-propeller type 1 domain-containing protein n=1 Tax=Malus domestica TaxID=3750 RepID=A0A498H9U0_MALDO|nr:hypothetical protein DVH24_027916 [Malus domestica]
MKFFLKMGSWRTVEGLNHVELIGRGLLLNGALHWLDRKRGEGSQIDSKLRIISFDLAQENFQELVRLPIVIEEQSMIWADVLEVQIKYSGRNWWNTFQKLVEHFSASMMLGIIEVLIFCVFLPISAAETGV